MESIIIIRVHYVLYLVSGATKSAGSYIAVMNLLVVEVIKPPDGK